MVRISIVEFEGIEADVLPSPILKQLLEIKGFYVRNGKLIPHSVAGYILLDTYHIIVKSRLKDEDFSRILIKGGFPSHLLEKGFDNLEVFTQMADFYLSQLKQTLITSGPPREQERDIVESTVVKGKVRRVYPHRIEQQIWENRTSPLATMLLKAAKIAYSINPSRKNHYQLEEIKKLMELTSHTEKMEDIPIFRVPKPYRDLYLMARMLLQSEGFRVESGQSPSFVFLVNTAMLFENYVRKMLEGEFSLQYQRTFTFGTISIRPDFLIEGVPADAKYRFSIDRNDVYQAIAYSTLLDKDRVFLLYPYIDEEINISCCKILAVGVLVHDAFEKLKKEVHNA